MNITRFTRIGNNNTSLVLIMVVIALSTIIVFMILNPGNSVKTDKSEKHDNTKDKITGKSESLDKTGVNLPPETLKEYIPQGAKYVITRKTGIVIQGKDRDWVNPNDLIMIGVYGEDKHMREIEKNDGEYFVEVRTVEMDRAIKVLSPKGRFEFDLDESQNLFLHSLAFSEKDRLLPLDTQSEVVNQIFAKPGSSPADGGKMFKVSSGTEKKKIRIISKKGKGVISVEPIDCELNEEERRHYFTQIPFVVPTQLAGNLKPGDYVTIPAWLLRDSLDKIDGDSASSIPTGKIVLKREDDIKHDDDTLASFQILKEGSQLELSSDEKEGKVNLALVPFGGLKFSKSDKCIRESKFSGNLDVRLKPKNKSLENTILLDKPLLRHTYYCKKIAG